MAWDGKIERRKVDSLNRDFRADLIRRLDLIDFDGKLINKKIDDLASVIENTNANVKSAKVILDKEIESMRISLQGDESKGVIGVVAKLVTLVREFSDHIIQDRWAYGLMISILLAILVVIMHKA